MIIGIKNGKIEPGDRWNLAVVRASRTQPELEVEEKTRWSWPWSDEWCCTEKILVSLGEEVRAFQWSRKRNQWKEIPVEEF